MADPFEDHERRSAQQAAAYASEDRQRQQAQPVKSADLTLADRVRARVEFSVRKCAVYDMDDYQISRTVDETIDAWSTSELLNAISIELEAKENGE